MYDDWSSQTETWYFSANKDSFLQFQGYLDYSKLQNPDQDSIQLKLHPIIELCHEKICLKIFVIVIPKEGLAGGWGPANPSFGMTLTTEFNL